MHTHALVRPRSLSLVGILALVMALVPFAFSPAAAQTDPAMPDDTASDALNLTGTDPVEFALRWSQVTYTPLTGEVDNAPTEALLGRDDLFADNLAAGSLMGQAIENGRPLYLTPTDSLDADVLAEMERVLPDGATVNVLGGEEAISTDVESELTDAGFTVNRLEGETRVETAVAIAEQRDSDTVLVVRAFPGSTGDATQAFADSLGAGALAATNGWEILFTQTETLTGNTAAALEAGDYSQAYVVGGTAAITEDTFDEVAAIVAGTERVDGATRFETAVNLNELRTQALGDAAIIVDGQADDAWADGFPAANLSGLNNYPLVLSNQGEIPAETQSYLAEFGGDAATTPTFAAHFTDVALVCGNTVDEPTCAEALEAINGNADGEVREFPPAEVDGPQDNLTFTEAPELLRATVEDQTEDQVQLRFTFDEQITGKAPVASCFHLYAFDLSGFSSDTDAQECAGHMGDVNANPASADGTVAEIATDDSTAVIVTFPLSEEEFASTTVATVDWDAVQDDDQIQNLEGDYPLEGMVTGGTTSAPDLVEVRDFDADLDTVEFVFDEDLAEAVTDPTGFVLIDGQGDTLTSDAAERSTVDGEENVVIATFDADANDEDAGPGIESTTEGDIVRAGVTADSVTEDGGDATNPLQVIEVAADGVTEDPDLMSVVVDRDADTVTYTFDVAVQLTTDDACALPESPIPGAPLPIGATPATCFQVYDRSATETPATEVTRSTDNMSVVATFADGELEDILGASVDADAVSAVEGTENPGNEIDELPIEDFEIAAGATVGPDLVSAEVRATNVLDTETVVAYTFDEDVETADAGPLGGAATPDATRFFVYDADGMPTRGETAQVDEDDPRVVLVTFDENEQVTGDAVDATVNDLAVVDADGDSNPEGAAGGL